MGDWFAEDAKKSLVEAVRSIEAKSAAEIVVTVRRRSASYLQTDFLLGSVFAAIALFTYSYAPAEFDDDIAPLLIVVAWIAGALLSRSIPAVKRLLTTEDARRQAVSLAARAAFLEQGIDRTTGRTGVLAYVSLLERRVELVCDRGVPHQDIPEWADVVAELQACMDRGSTAQAIAETLGKLRNGLGKALPVRADDVNELPDEVVS